MELRGSTKHRKKRFGIFDKTEQKIKVENQILSKAKKIRL